MRSRNIKPNLFKNELLGVADPMLTIVFAGLWCMADREGRMEDRPLRLKAEILPYREGIDFNGYLTELASLEFICRYKVGKTSIIQILNFKKHQNPHKTEKKSELPSMQKSTTETDGCALTVKDTLNNGTSRADSLIPDSLIPDSPVERKAKQNIPFLEIVSFLNEKSGQNYKSTTVATKKHITARWNDGFTIDDFKKVIDAKCGEWKDDEKMSKFLRPETLFGNKFEGYLNGSGSSNGLMVAPNCNKCQYNQSRPCVKITTPGFDVKTCTYFKDTENE